MNGPQLVDQIGRRRASLLTAQMIEPTTLGTTAVSVYTAKADADFAIQHLAASNITGSAQTFTLYFVPDGGAAGTGNTVLQKSLAANEALVIDIAKGHRLPEGASIQAFAGNASAVNIFGWGYDQRGEP